MPPRNFSQTYRYDELAGHNPNTAWWATPLAWVIIFALLIFIWALATWF